MPKKELIHVLSFNLCCQYYTSNNRETLHWQPTLSELANLMGLLSFQLQSGLALIGRMI